MDIKNNKIYSAEKDVILLEFLNFEYINIQKNEILKNSGSGIKLVDVRNERNNPQNVYI